MEAEDPAVVDDAVDDRGGHVPVAEHDAPSAGLEVRGGDDAAGLVAVRAGLEQERRALRVLPEGLRWDWPDPSSLQLSFSLPPGSYATAVLAQLGAVIVAGGMEGPADARSRRRPSS